MKSYLEKYCIFDEEEILCSFFGGVEYKSKRKKPIVFLNRVFITNYRIIISDVFRSSSSGGSVFIPWAGLTFNIINKMVNSMIDHAMDPKNRYVPKSAESKDMEKVILGYQFPIFNPTAITMPIMKKGVRWNSYVPGLLPHWKQGMDEEIVYSVKFTSQVQPDPLDLSIYINPHKLIFEAEREYEDGQKMLHKIAEILHNLQEQQIIEST